MNDSPDEFRDWDAAYVLGALSAEDRREYEQHLTNCPACTSAVAELAGMPGLLRKLQAEDAEALMTVPDDGHLRGQQHEPGLVHRLATTANKRRRRVRAAALALMAGVAATLAFGGIFIGASLPPSAHVARPPATSAPTGTAVMMTPVQPGTMTAILMVSSKAWGTRFDWTCDYENVDAKMNAASRSRFTSGITSSQSVTKLSRTAVRVSALVRWSFGWSRSGLFFSRLRNVSSRIASVHFA